ncbi:hypothetical protein HWV62_25840 [Athelia sp. TMB]|nr:hypothetical protein HWV62_25840 [Athelia sp. TMB]
MLARLSRKAAHLLDLPGSSSEHEGPDSLTASELEPYSIDVRVLSSLLPTPDIPWMRVAGALAPVCKGVHDMLVGDAEYVEALMADLDPGSAEDVDEEGEEQEAESSQSPSLGTRSVPLPLVLASAGQRHKREPQFSLPRRPHTPHKKRRRPSVKQLDHPLLIPSTHPSAPSILITPCGPAPIPVRAATWVPLQDAAFGMQLAVPGYPAFNAPAFHPPCAPNPAHARTPLIERWRWRGGHWCAVVPDIDTQTRKGWFARPVSVKRRSSRPAVAQKP